MAMDQAVHKVSLSGPILAHILQDFRTGHGDCDGILFGHLQTTISPKLEDDDDQSGPHEELTAVITGFYCSGSLFSFYDVCGCIDPLKLSRIIGDREKRGGDPLIGWFLGRRNTPLRPSLRETAVTKALCFSHSGLAPNQGGAASPVPHEADGKVLGPYIPHSSPCLFMLLTESGAGLPVHTHEYRVYQYLFASQTFEPRALNIVNIGPAFRVQYDSFAPVSAFPPLLSSMEYKSESDSSSTGLKAKRRDVHQGSHRTHTPLPKEQALMDVYAEGYKVERLASLADHDGMRQVPELEDLYSKMLFKLEILAKQVCESSAALMQQENANKQLRLNAASLE